MNVIQRNLGSIPGLKKNADTKVIMDCLEELEDSVSITNKDPISPTRSTGIFTAQTKQGMQNSSLKKSSKDLRANITKKGTSSQCLKDSKIKVTNGGGPLTKKSEHSLSAKDVRRTSKR